jgi:hypothetical protein
MVCRVSIVIGSGLDDRGSNLSAENMAVGEEDDGLVGLVENPSAKRAIASAIRDRDACSTRNRPKHALRVVIRRGPRWHHFNDIGRSFERPSLSFDGNVQGYPSLRGKPIARHLLPDIDPKRHSTAVGSSDLLWSDAESEGIEASEGIGCPKVWQEAP